MDDLERQFIQVLVQSKIIPFAEEIEINTLLALCFSLAILGVGDRDMHLSLIKKITEEKMGVFEELSHFQASIYNMLRLHHKSGPWPEVAQLLQKKYSKATSQKLARNLEEYTQNVVEENEMQMGSQRATSQQNYT